MPKLTAAAKRSKRLASMANFASIVKPKESRAPPKTCKKTIPKISVKSYTKPSSQSESCTKSLRKKPASCLNESFEVSSEDEHADEIAGPSNEARVALLKCAEERKSAEQAQRLLSANEDTDEDSSVDGEKSYTKPSSKSASCTKSLRKKPASCLNETFEVSFEDEHAEEIAGPSDAARVALLKCAEERKSAEQAQRLLSANEDTDEDISADGEGRGSEVQGKPLATSTDEEMESFLAMDDAKSCPNQTEKQKIEKLLTKIKKLEADKARLTALNFSLQEALMAKPDAFKFKLVEGFPEPEWLLKASITANDSDYIFVKELMMKLWPNGCGNATVSGRKSNNPSGIKSRAHPAVPQDPDYVRADVTQLDPIKVDYIKDRLFERRLILNDQCHTAQMMAKQVTKHIARALANNPKLRIQKT